ncbi:uncharacterized protein LOC131697767 [Acipenser ruthenus]|uniref:uncharacterized protein LOC131697767 n=1 Tax=Acipenser ruthenus TaxID=7906 RepID=UPI0027423906|nr:uncharacterized protein LOC131697767 [Acipenser ruthenus]
MEAVSAQGVARVDRQGSVHQEQDWEAGADLGPASLVVPSPAPADPQSTSSIARPLLPSAVSQDARPHVGIQADVHLARVPRPQADWRRLYKTVRRVLSIDDWYDMAMVYLECRWCKKKVAGWSGHVLNQLDPAHRSHFPAILTYRLSCDMSAEADAGAHSGKQCHPAVQYAVQTAQRGLDAAVPAVPHRVRALSGPGNRAAQHRTPSHAAGAQTPMAAESVRLRRPLVAGRGQGRGHLHVRVHPENGLDQEGKNDLLTSYVYTEHLHIKLLFKKPNKKKPTKFC